jgi:hypothetical protein
MGCTLPVYNVYFASERHRTQSKCESLKNASEWGENVFCFELSQDKPDGYGTAKILAVNAVPLTQVMLTAC